MKNRKYQHKNRYSKINNWQTRSSPGIAEHQLDEIQPINADYSGDSDVLSPKVRLASRCQKDSDQYQPTPEFYTPPQTENEKLMASIWREILKLKKISMNDNFFDYGRDSYLAMEFVARVRKVFAVNLSLKSLFEEPTVAGMTAAVLRNQHLRTTHQPRSTGVRGYRPKTNGRNG